MPHFDLIVIGAGAAGLTALYTALGLGKRVLLVEKALPGGECTWSGCMPSKALINQANSFYEASKYGALVADGPQVMARVRQVSQNVYAHENPEVLINAGAQYVQGQARFLSAHVIEVNGTTYQGKAFILATGSSPALPDLPGLASVDFLTNESLFRLRDLPTSLLILGGGVIGLELAQAMNRLGVAVTVLEMQAEVLAREEPEMAALVRGQLAAEGVCFQLATQALAVEKTASGVRVQTRSQQGEGQIEGEALLVALGRRPNCQGLGLEALGINLDHGLKVNKYLQTQCKHIYACGDLVGPYLLSHMANYQAKRATLNALLPWRQAVDYRHRCWTIFTDPELAHAGLTESEARAHYGDSIRVYRFDMAQLDRVMTKEGDQGLIKVILDRKGQILGAHIWAQRAGDLLAPIQLLKTKKIKFTQLQSVIHPYPTYAEALRKLSQQVFLDDLRNLLPLRWWRALTAWRHRQPN